MDNYETTFEPPLNTITHAKKKIQVGLKRVYYTQEDGSWAKIKISQKQLD